MRKIIAVLLTMGILASCSGCSRKQVGVRVVEQISVEWTEDGQTFHRIHGEPEKMHLILNRIRTLGQRFSTDVDPETLASPTVMMTVIYSDGAQRLYQIKPDRYIRIGHADWQQADPKKITSLRLLLLSLPGDLYA